MRFRLSNILIFLVTAFLMSCGQGKEGLSGDVIYNPNSATGNSDKSVLPVFKFDNSEHDFGKIFEGETVAFNFKFTNTGKTDLVISDVSTSCGCTVPEWPKQPVRPGESGSIRVSFNSSGKHGFQHKNIVIVANTQPNSTVLQIRAEVVTAGSRK